VASDSYDASGVRRTATAGRHHNETPTVGLC